MSRNFGWLFLVMLPAGALAGLLLAAVITHVIPKQYESEAVIELGPLHWDMPIESTEGEGEAPVHVLEEIGRIKSRESLDEVIQNLDLETRWNLKRGEVREILSQRLQVQCIRGTDLVSIRMRHASKADARDIALEIANVCKERRAGIVSREAERRIHELKESLGKQEEKVEALIQVNKSPGRNDEVSGNGKSELESGQEMLLALRRKLMGETIAAKITDDRTPIHEMPHISHEPVFPNVTLSLVLGAVLGFLLSPLMALLAIMILRRRIPTASAG